MFRLLLLHPVTGPVQQMTASHVRAGASLHALEVARALIYSPVALPSNEQGWDIDGAAEEQLEHTAVLAPCGAAIPLQAALKAGPAVLCTIHGELFVRQPRTRGNLGRRGHL